MSTISHRFTKAWWFVLPGLFLMILVVGVPLAIGFRYSLHDVFLYSFQNQWFVGLDNYREVLADPLYRRAVRTTVIFTLFNLLFTVFFGLLIAWLVNNKNVKYRSAWLAAFLVPFVVAPVVGGIAWRFFMWQQEFGVINQFLGLFGVEPRYWLLDRETALAATIISNAWNLTPICILVYYAALSTIPDDLIEASTIDGANPLQTLWSIIIPLLRPHTLFVSIIIVTSAFREFDTIWAMTGGGPGRATTTLSIFAYNRGIANQDMGIANTVSFTMFVIMATFAWIYITLYRRAGGEK